MFWLVLLLFTIFLKQTGEGKVESQHDQAEGRKGVLTHADVSLKKRKLSESPCYITYFLNSEFSSIVLIKTYLFITVRGKKLMQHAARHCFLFIMHYAINAHAT